MQRRTCLTAYKESATAATHKIERLRYENPIHHGSACPPSEQDHELQEVYRHLSNAEHGWNHTHMLLDITREEVHAPPEPTDPEEIDAISGIDED
jgi:hypothetical protein